MAPSEPRDDPPLDGLLRNASPDGDMLAQHALHELEARLFGTPRPTIRIGRYRLGERLGAGGSGVVHRARDPKHDREIALKLLHAEQGPRYEAARDRLLREAQTLGKLRHPNIVQIYDVGTYDPAVLDPSPPERSRAEGVYLAMELLDGADLASWLSEHPRGWQQIREVFLAAGRGLAAAHARGLIHRDFKPANVVIDAEGMVRVLDFGLARPTIKDISDPSQGLTAGAQQRLEALARPLDATLTAPGTLLGTPAYMAPEQHDLERATARSDQYSFCLSLYEAWVGHRPFLADTEQELRRLKREGTVLPPPEDCEVPRVYLDAITRGMSPRPDDRFPSMDALLEALTLPPRTRGNWRGLVPMATALTVALAGVGLWAWSSMDDGCDWAHSMRWGDAERDVLLSAANSQGAYAQRAAATIADELDDRVGAIHRSGAERCDASDEPPSACWTRRQQRLTMLLDALPDVDGPTLLLVSRWLSQAPRMDACGDGAFTESLASLHDARLLAALGRTGAAHERAELAHAQASREADPSRIERAAALHGRLALASGALSEAEAALTEALWSGGIDELSAPTLAAAEDLLELARRAEPRPGDASLWSRIAREHATMPEVPASTRLRLHLGLGRLALADGDLDRARADLEQGLQLPLAELDPEVLYETRLCLGEILERRGESERARTLRARARAEAIDQLGVEHPLLSTP